MAKFVSRLRKTLGATCVALAIVFVAWLPLGFSDVIPFVFALPNESGLRTHAGIAITCLLIAAWGFWES